MAQVANTFETFDAVGNRETLADKIWMTTPEETPFLSLIGRKSVSGVKPEWQVDALKTPDLNNNVPEGNDWNYQAVVATTRVANFCQISETSFIISNTQETVDKAGRKSEIAREAGKKGTELKIDMEVIALSNQASLAGSGNGATNRRLGGFRAWLASNDVINGGASGGFNTGTGVVDAATNGTQRAFTKALLDECILNTYNNGGNPTTLLVSPYVKQVFSAQMDAADVALPRSEVKGKDQVTIYAAADMYISDFGPIAVVPNRQMARAGATVARNAFLIDPKMVTLGVLRDIEVYKPSITGDAEKRAMNVEYTLMVNNERAHGVVADLFGLTASS
jgi:hypothetical protein